MATERRYTEEEVAEILDRATEAQTQRVPTGSGGDGFTLRELHEIGREVGIPEDVLTTAAAQLDRAVPDAVAQKTFLRQTIGVGRTVDLPRTLTDDEWHRLVMDLRETFSADGKAENLGAFREWRNSNLRVLVEPKEDGAQLRLQTIKGNARTFQGMGAAFATAGAALGVSSFLGLAGDPADAVIFGAVGVGFFLWSRLTVPFWAKTRARQFEALTARVTEMLSRAPSGRDALPRSPLDDSEL